MKKIIKFILLFLFLSCATVFVNEEELNIIWVGKHQSEIINKLGPYTRVLDDLSEDESKIIIWEASQESGLLSLEKIGGRILHIFCASLNLNF